MMVLMKGHSSNVSNNQNRRSTLSKDYDISTQRRHSNDHSRFNDHEACEDDETELLQ